MTLKQETNLKSLSLYFIVQRSSKVLLGNPILDIYCTIKYLRKQSFIGSVSSLSGHFHTLAVMRKPHAPMRIQALWKINQNWSFLLGDPTMIQPN